ncbi:MAG TPA: DNA double-strand break repair nuclease NurA [Ktedonobacterales bacterium]|nr:DNA double-strand break repair nuclease NurA [Ktedonobacterales bacterium]
MLYAPKVAAALEAKKASFAQREHSFVGELESYRAALRDLGAQYPHATALMGRLESAREGKGALPLVAAYDARMAALAPRHPPIIPFDMSFANHEEARAWAEQIIAGVTTVAVDGSQIMPWRDASIPVALVQAGIFVNPHATAQSYIKDVIVDILGPGDLVPPAEYQDEEDILHLAAEEIVNLRRFELETHTLAQWMREHPAQDGAPKPVVLLDGSLIVSFALTMPPQLRARYIAAVTDLLAASEASQVPLAAYIDTSHARDLTTMLGAVFPERALAGTKRLHDALLWGEDMGWGDYSLPFISARGDVLADYGAQRGSIAFTYLRAAQDRPPARIEMPRWVAEGPDFPYVIDVLRAELIAGGGYPYAIETADAVAVISVEDRARFYRMFQQFAGDMGLELRFSHKALSKSRRRA